MMYQIFLQILKVIGRMFEECIDTGGKSGTSIAFGVGRFTKEAWHGSDGRSYTPVILLFFVLRVAASLCMLKISLNFKPASKYLWRELCHSLAQTKVRAD